jgi:TRAP-type mannitol/chloroaromatic compound transport system permease large subunit
MAAMIPGLCLALLFMLYIMIWSILNRRNFNPVYDSVGDEG